MRNARRVPHFPPPQQQQPPPAARRERAPQLRTKRRSAPRRAFACPLPPRDGRAGLRRQSWRGGRGRKNRRAARPPLPRLRGSASRPLASLRWGRPPGASLPNRKPGAASCGRFPTSAAQPGRFAPRALAKSVAARGIFPAGGRDVRGRKSPGRKNALRGVMRAAALRPRFAAPRLPGARRAAARSLRSIGAGRNPRAAPLRSRRRCRAGIPAPRQISRGNPRCGWQPAKNKSAVSSRSAARPPPLASAHVRSSWPPLPPFGFPPRSRSSAVGRPLAQFRWSGLRPSVLLRLRGSVIGFAAGGHAARIKRFAGAAAPEPLPGSAIQRGAARGGAGGPRRRRSSKPVKHKKGEDPLTRRRGETVGARSPNSLGDRAHLWQGRAKEWRAQPREGTTGGGKSICDEPAGRSDD